jgi:hypothetical protein
MTNNDNYTVETGIVIEAGIETVWNVLMKTDEWKDWNPTFSIIVGDTNSTPTVFQEGRAFEVHVTLLPTDHNATTTATTNSHPNVIVAHPVVTRLDANEKVLIWRSTIGCCGGCLFRGTHYIVLVERGEHLTRLYHQEDMKGCLVPLLQHVTGHVEMTRQGFVRMNEALKARCENSY